MLMFEFEYIEYWYFEFYVLLRKYQYTFSQITLNDSIVINFRNSVDDIKFNNSLDDLQSIFYSKKSNSHTSESEKRIEFDIELIPKFLKHEFQFEIPNDLLTIHILLTFTPDFTTLLPNKTSLLITNLTADVFKSKKIAKNFSLYLSTLLFEFIKNNFEFNVIEGVNKFLVRIENYLPQVFVDFDKEYSKKMEWTEDEILKFKEGLGNSLDRPKIEEKIETILQLVKTKSFESCLERFQQISSFNSKVEKNELNINESKQIKLKNPEKKSLVTFNLESKFLLKDNNEKINCLVYINFGELTNIIASVGSHNVIKLWDCSKKILIKKYKGHTKAINSLLFLNYDSSSSNKKDENKEIYPLLISGSEDKTIKVWLLNGTNDDEACIKTITVHSKSVSFLAPHEKDKFISTGFDGVINLWKIKDLSFTCEATLSNGHKGHIFCLSFIENGKYIASGGSDKIINIWNPKNKKMSFSLKGHSEGVSCVVYTKMRIKDHIKDFLISGSLDTTIKVWDLQTKKESHTLSGHYKAILSILLLDGVANGENTNDVILSGSADLTLKIWNIDTGECYNSYDYFHSSSILCFVQLSDLDGIILASGGNDGIIQVYEYRDGVEVEYEK